MIVLNDSKAENQSFGGAVEQAAARVIASGWFILGEEVKAFETEFADFVGTGHAAGVASGTEALQLALMAFDVGRGDEVITVPNTAVATVAAIESTGATPVFVDIDPVTYLLDPAKLEDAITPRTKAVIPVHLYGQVAPMDEILSIARRRGIRVIEDACQAHGAIYKSKRAGSMGDAGCFSFYPSKNLAGIGDGGMVVTNDVEIDAKLRYLRQYGWTPTVRDNSLIKGINSRLDELQAAVLRAKLPHLQSRNNARRAIAKRYLAALAGTDFGLPVEIAEGQSVWHLFVVRTPVREGFQAWMTQHGVATGCHYPMPIYLQDAYAGLGLSTGHCPVSEAVQSEIVTLPLYPELSETDQEKIIESAIAYQKRG